MILRNFVLSVLAFLLQNGRVKQVAASNVQPCGALQPRESNQVESEHFALDSFPQNGIFRPSHFSI